MRLTYSTDYVLVIRKMCFTPLTPVDATGVEVDVVCEPHLVLPWWYPVFPLSRVVVVVGNVIAPSNAPL